MNKMTKLDFGPPPTPEQRLERKAAAEKANRERLARTSLMDKERAEWLRNMTPAESAAYINYLM
jgi:hypothetical protein